MPLRTHTCLSLACDVCREPLRDDESGTLLHFDTEAEARETARRYGWPITIGGPLICPTVDSVHQVALDQLMPPEPLLVPDGQGELWPEGGAR